MTEVTSKTEAGTAEKWKRRNPWLDLVRRLFKEKPLGAFGFVVTFLLLFTGIFANQLAPYPMNDIHLADRLLPPFSPGYFLGTDHLGRDLLSSLIYGARVSVIIGLSATALAQLISTSLGVTCGYFMGNFDLILQRIIDAITAIPQLLILLTIMGIVGQGVTQLILVLAITGGLSGQRLKRSMTLSIKENAYVQASEVIGCSTWQTMWRHLIPNILSIIIINFSMGIGGTIMAEASLSFLGFGVPPGVPSWGAMISQEGRRYMEVAPQLAIWPGLSLALVVYSVNMLGDAMRDLLDPRLRGGLGRYSISQKQLKKIGSAVGAESES